MSHADGGAGGGTRSNSSTIECSTDIEHQYLSIGMAITVLGIALCAVCVIYSYVGEACGERDPRRVIGGICCLYIVVCSIMIFITMNEQSVDLPTNACMCGHGCGWCNETMSCVPDYSAQCDAALIFCSERTSDHIDDGVQAQHTPANAQDDGDDLDVGVTALMPDANGCNSQTNSFQVDASGAPVADGGVTWANVQKQRTKAVNQVVTVICESYTTTEVCSCVGLDEEKRWLVEGDESPRPEPLIKDTTSWESPSSWSLARWVSLFMVAISCCTSARVVYYGFAGRGDSDDVDHKNATIVGATCCCLCIILLYCTYFFTGVPSLEYEAEMELVGESQQSIIAVGDSDEWTAITEWHVKRWLIVALAMCACGGIFIIHDRHDWPRDAQIGLCTACICLFVVAVLTTSTESAMTCPGGYDCDEICLTEPETCMLEPDLHPDWCSRHASLCREWCEEHRDRCAGGSTRPLLSSMAQTRVRGLWSPCTQPCGSNGTQQRPTYCPVAQQWRTIESNETMITVDGMHWLNDSVRFIDQDMWALVNDTPACVAATETRSCNAFSCGCADRGGFQSTPEGECQLCPVGTSYDDATVQTTWVPVEGVTSRECLPGEPFDQNNLCSGIVSVTGFVCTNCELGKFADSGALECSSCPTGTHTMVVGANSSSECLPCRPTTSGYPACMGGRCDPRHADVPGTLCEECAGNHYRSAYDCKECGNVVLTLVIVLVALLALVGGPTYVIASTGTHFVSHADLAYGNYDALSSFSSACGQTQRFLEMITPNFHWPKTWLELAAKIRALIAIDLPDLAPPECQIDMTPSEGVYYRTLFAFLTIPILSLCVALALGCVNKMKLKDKRETRTKLWWEATVQIHSVLFLTVVKAGLRSVDCTDTADGPVLDQNVAVACDANDPSYNNARFVGVSMLLVYGLIMSILHAPNWCEVAGLLKKGLVAFATVMLSAERNTVFAVILLAGTAFLLLVLSHTLYTRYYAGVGWKVLTIRPVLQLHAFQQL